MVQTSNHDPTLAAPPPGDCVRASPEHSQDQPTIFFVSNIRLYREAFCQHISRCREVRIIGAAESSKATFDLIAELTPDVAVVDVAMNGGADTVRDLRIRAPSTKVVAFAVAEADHEFLACAEAGIAGYVPPDGSVEDLVAAITDAVHGKLRCSGRIAAILLERVTALSNSQMQTAPAVALTQREHDIVRLIDGGLSNKEIARHLHISDATVKNHIHNILAKLHVHRRTEATAWIRERAPKLPTVLCAIWLYSSFFV